MADKREGSHADELLNILQNFRDDQKGEPTSPPAEEATHDDIDEALDILNAGLAARKGEEKEDEIKLSDSTAKDDGMSEEADIPVSIFGHLKDESEIEEVPVPIGGGQSNLHFTDEPTDGTDLPIEEPEDENDYEGEDENDEGEKEEDNSPAIVKFGRIFQKMSALPKAVIYIVLIVLVSAYLSYYIVTIGNDIFALVTTSSEVEITIEEGMTDEDVAELLESEGIIEYGWVYELYMKYRGDGDTATEYVPGTYTLRTDHNYSQIIYIITTKSVERAVVRITVPEGFTVEQTIELLVQNGIGTREGYVEAINNYPYKWEFVKLLDERGYSKDRKYRLEGYLYPDTYDFYNTESEVYVINKMLAAFDAKFWRDFNRESSAGNSYRKTMEEKYGLDFDDVVVLASMIQSEGGNAEDFYYISHVFHNRLASPREYPFLQSDATIQYVLPERETDSSQIDISLDTPYNTYLYEGLPPGAISSPGLDALNAALFPEPPKNSSGKDFTAYYFVSNDAGKTYYAATKSSHQKNVDQVKKDNEAIKNGTYRPSDEDYE